MLFWGSSVSRQIRESLLLTDPSEKQYFTRTELELVSGIPTNIGDQDDLKELMTPSPEEFKFWEKKRILPSYMIKDRFNGPIDSIDSKDSNLVYKTSNIVENKVKLS